MFRLLLRFLGLCLLAIAFASLIVDARRSVMSGNLYITPIGDTLLALAPAKLAMARVLIQHYVGPFIWDPILVGLMRLPVWLAAGVAGGLAAWLGKKPAPKFGFSSR
jgi:hypothetical protein